MVAYFAASGQWCIDVLCGILFMIQRKEAGNMTFQEKIYNLRAEKNLSQEKLAEELAVSRQTVAKWETGKAYPEIEKLVSISRYFGLTIDALVKPSACDEPLPGTKAGTAPHGQIIDFLLLAKRSCYAAQSPEHAPSRPASHDWRFERGPLMYIDSYVGGEIFSGQEVVYQNGLAIWSMNYCGRVLGEGFSGEFLKEALLLGTPEYPYRGPLLYKKGQYTYHTFIEGTFDWYVGHEEIFFADQKVYECRYNGGSLV